MPEMLAKWFSEFLLAVFFAVGLPLLWRVSNALKDLKVSIDGLRDSMDRASGTLEKVRDEVDQLHDDVGKVRGEQSRQHEKLESGFAHIRDLLRRNGVGKHS